MATRCSPISCAIAGIAREGARRDHARARCPIRRRRSTRETAAQAFADILDGARRDEAIAAFLIALSERGETSVEIAEAARALRARLIPIAAPAGAIDVCGTGGDGHHTLNVSTAVALVVAACGVPVAKHGNRAASSKAGAADTLEALGLDLDRAGATAEATPRRSRHRFLFAAQPPSGDGAHHARSASAIGRRTIFNLMGPLANPARRHAPADRHRPPRLRADLCRGARAARHRSGAGRLGRGRARRTVGRRPERRRSRRRRRAARRAIAPEDAGLPRHPLDAIRGGDPAYNAAALRRLLHGEPGAYRDAVLLNAAAALIVAGARRHSGATAPRKPPRRSTSGAANALLDCWIAYS